VDCTHRLLGAVVLEKRFWNGSFHVVEQSRAGGIAIELEWGYLGTRWTLEQVSKRNNIVTMEAYLMVDSGDLLE
jgi:hypothetical protein